MTKYQNSLNLLLIFHFVHQHNHSFLQTPQGMPPWFNLQTEWELLLLSKKRKVLVISWVKKSFNNKQSNCYKSLSVIHVEFSIAYWYIYLFATAGAFIFRGRLLWSDISNKFHIGVCVFALQHFLRKQSCFFTLLPRGQMTAIYFIGSHSLFCGNGLSVFLWRGKLILRQWTLNQFIIWRLK